MAWFNRVLVVLLGDAVLPSPNPLPGEGSNPTGHNNCVQNYMNNSEWMALRI